MYSHARGIPAHKTQVQCMAMAGIGDERDSDSSSSSPRAKPGHHEGSHVVHLLTVGDKVKYPIPSFRFVTVELQHVVVSGGIEADGVNRQYDVFLKCCPEVHLSAPCSINVLDSGYIAVSY